MRREILTLLVVCLFSEVGCNWEGKYEDFYHHIEVCDFASFICEYCGERVRRSQLEAHNRSCPCIPKLCPLSELGCTKTAMVDKKLQEHIEESALQHIELIASQLKHLKQRLQESKLLKADACKQVSQSRYLGERIPDFVEADSAGQGLTCFDSTADKRLKVRNKSQHVARLQDVSEFKGEHAMQVMLNSMLVEKVTEVKKELMKTVMEELRAKEEEIAGLKMAVTKMEKTLRLKNAEHEDRDFRLSLIENGNHDGTMIWKIPQFSQRKADAVNGKYTSIFSLPFYSGRYGYKMCLRLYIMGDGIGKGTHLSLFFVVMRGEFDNILQWPFTHKVTFKLINQSGGRDIVDTFQPDPMSSSFRKPKSDMNIASGCPRFVSHTELERGGFIVDDTIFVKCLIDTSTIRHP